MTFLNIDDIHLGNPVRAAHNIYLDAYYRLKEGKKRSIVFKTNKYQDSEYSRLEAAFSQLAYLLIGKNFTAQQTLVTDQKGTVLGLASEHIYYVIARKEGLNNSFYSLNNPELNCECTAKQLSSAKEIPVYFLNQVPHGFFAQLMTAEKEGSLSIDHASLAKVLTTSYTLEEDDLHKGNFGFYLVEKEGKPKVVFFKIDHDLMFANAIMSFYSIRPQHFFYNEHAFDINAEDLINFPKVNHSANTYWPTKLSSIPNPWSEKEYHNEEEVNAFANLAEIPAFKRAKWLSFYKHILITSELHEEALEQCFDKNTAADRARIALIAQAMNARQASLRAMLFSLEEFRDFLKSLSDDEKQNLVNDVIETATHANKAAVTDRLNQSLSVYDQLCSSRFEKGDTPLHAAIKLGDFRYEETLVAYSHFINIKNNAGKTPLDCALEMLSEQRVSSTKDVRKDLRLTMKYLLKNGAVESPEFNNFNSMEHLENYQFQTAYINRAVVCSDFADLKNLLRDIGEDHSYCLKFKKKIAVECIKQFIDSHKNVPGLDLLLTQLKKEISDEIPEFKYIRQLRSSLWIIRQIRGLYGWTSTQSEINSLINQASTWLKCNHSSSFFNNKHQPSAAAKADDNFEEIDPMSNPS